VRRREQTLGETERRLQAVGGENEARAAEIARLERQVRELASAVSERDARIRALSGALDDETARRRTDQREAQQTAGALRDRTRELEARLSSAASGSSTPSARRVPPRATRCACWRPNWRG
jgi:predicted RNase H-like nuclease (RuvC/YqgF family)